MSTTMIRDALIALLCAAALAAATPLYAQGPAVELEGYYARALPQANDCAAPPAPAAQIHAHAIASPPSADGDEPSGALVAQLNADFDPNHATRR
jgi:uncharacterized membrane protein